jgi:Tol biopolymer transport system component/C-terminal processing protease CtpA/Prc
MVSGVDMRTINSILLVTGVLTTIVAAGVVEAAEPARWLRYPGISPDGETIVFSYRGDLYRVPSNGGTATPLTVHSSHDTTPVWSPDSSKVAFASDRYGNFDVFVMPASGGAATRLTYHSANDLPTSFTPDGGSVLFRSARLDARTCVQFPTGAQPELYRELLEGGMPEQVLTTPANYAVYDTSGGRLAYSDEKSYEDEWRKHDDSSFARDVWMYDVASGQHTRLTAFRADDRQPVWSPDEESLSYLSERSGTFNVWRLDLEDPSNPVMVTDHDTHPVRFLSASRDGDLCYAWDGEIWIRPAGETTSTKLDIGVATDSRYNQARWIDVARSITEFDLSPDGKEIAFIARGEVFVTSVDHATTRRITSTPEQERSVSFSPDGRSLLYAGERNGSWNLYRTDLTDDDEPSFFNATAFVERPVLEIEAETFQARFSPDGKELAYLEERTELKVLDLASGESRTILPGDVNYSYRDGDQWYEWSPDGRWFLVQYFPANRWGDEEVGLVPASGAGELINLTKSGYWDVLPRWAMGGEMMVWFSDRHGDRVQAGWPAQYDVLGAFFTRDAWDRFRMTEAEFEQQKERDKKADEKKKGDKEKEDEGKAEEEEDEIELPDPVDIELDGLEDRTVRLSLHSADLDEARLTPDGEKLLYLAKFEKGYDLWVYSHRKQEIKLLAKLNAEDADELQLDSDGKKAFVLADRQLKVVGVDGGKVKPVKLQAKMELDAAAERAYLYEHAWRQTKKKFYVEDLHGVDWDLYKAEYAKFLPHIDNNWDLAELISELQGELNASHLGSGHRPTREGADATAALAFFPDPAYEGDGIKIAEIIEGSPLERADTRIKPGVVIEAIDGERIAAGSNWYPLLNHKADTLVRLALYDPAGGERWQETVKPISGRQQSRLLYQRWARSRRTEVERLSNGRLGYAHIRGMSDGPYREIFDEIFGRHANKEGIVLDTRFNGGGNLVEALTVFLSGDVYYRLMTRGIERVSEPRRRWTKPSIVVMNEGNYSDAHCFPAAYTALGLGETVGMQVPGTCTSVWWETLQDRTVYFGIPQMGHVDRFGDMTENKHLDPDHGIDNDPTLEATGRDQQLERAVEVLLAKLDG